MGWQLMVQTDKKSYFIPIESQVEEEGSLVRFYVDSDLVLAVPREAFLWCEKVGKLSERGGE